MKKTLLTVALLVVAMASLSACSAGDLSKVGDEFMTALKNGDYAAAYALCGPDLQQEVGSAEGLQAAIPVALSEWSFSSISQSNDSGTLQGTAQGPDGAYDLTLVLQKVGDVWKIAGYNSTQAP
ncbi:MAG TPA: hypothetical protein VJ123_02235 [Anaerolineales bacterium]|nr:hypothetical protein [Anaerolineales bacterium]